MLNKQVNDPDVAGVGEFVEENFYNLGLADHPLQALNRMVRDDPTFRDDGRREVTFNDDDAFEFRVVTLRQIKDARFFFHNGAFSSVRDVVQYFNAGVPQDAEAAAASTFTTRFSHPRGPDSEPGLGLSDAQVDDITDFLENALYDPTFIESFMLTEEEMTYSEYRPDLAALGAVDGRPASGLPQDNNDPLSRRDMGLEFLDVTPQITMTLMESNSNGTQQEDKQRFMNTGASMVDTHLLVVVQGLPEGVQLANASGMTSEGEPYLRVFLDDGVLLPSRSIVESLMFERPSDAPTVSYTLKLLSGQGNP
jgi:hypothetical protein